MPVLGSISPLSTTALEAHLRPHHGSTHAQILYGLRLAAVELLIERWLEDLATTGQALPVTE